MWNALSEKNWGVIGVLSKIFRFFLFIWNYKKFIWNFLKFLLNFKSGYKISKQTPPNLRGFPSFSWELTSA